jgi:hypothetical protein
MAASDILLVDDAQDYCISLSDVIWDLDYLGSGAYVGLRGSCVPPSVHATESAPVWELRESLSPEGPRAGRVVSAGP